MEFNNESKLILNFEVQPTCQLLKKKINLHGLKKKFNFFFMVTILGSNFAKKNILMSNSCLSFNKKM